MNFFAVLITALFTDNLVFGQFLGICPFIGVSKKIDTAMGMGGAVIFVMLLSTIVTYLVNTFILVPLSLQFLQTVVFILVIAALVQILEIILKTTMPVLYQALGIFLPLITTNCTILGVAILVAKKGHDLVGAVVFALSNGLGFMLALIVLSSIRERLSMAKIPGPLADVPIALITAGIISMAFSGLAGIVK